MRILITGGNGFIGAWIARRLAADGHSLRLFDIVERRDIVTAIAGAKIADAAEWVTGDIVDGLAVKAAAADCDGIIHMAGILTPACAADPVRGAQVNVIGTLNMFEAARAHGIRRIVYTSSAGVFGPDQGTEPFPITHYGTFKLANEGAARAYFADHGLPSVGFRPYVVYGPGRETGLTAGPTLAARAAARGEAYTLPYKGAAGLVYVDDVAAAYVAALLREPDGAHVFNMVGELASCEQVVAAIKRHVNDARISIDGPDLPFTPDVPEGNVREVLGAIPATTLADGMGDTIAFYRKQPR